MSRSYAVLGAGALGLTLALRLLQRGDQVVVYEREPLPGGLAAGFRVGDVWLEKFYHHLFETDTSAVALIEELGLGDKLVWRHPKTVVLRDGNLWPLDNASSVIKFSALSVADRARLGLAMGFLRARGRYEDPSGLTASAWIRKWMGEHTYRVLWEPLLSSKFGDRHEEIAMPWFWARVHYRTANLGYLRGGFQQFYDALAQRIVVLGGHVLLGTEVTEVVQSHGKLSVADLGASTDFDAVVSTLPTRVTARVVPSLPESYVSRYGNVEAYGATCLVLALDRKLTDGYWLNLNDPGFPFQPCVEHTNFMPAEDYNGRHLVYFGNYLPVSAELFSVGKEEMIARFLPAIRRLNSDFQPEWITDSWLFRAPFAQPIVTRTFRDSIPPHTTPIPGLYLANMFQVYPQDRGQNYSIKLAEHVVKNVL